MKAVLYIRVSSLRQVGNTSAGTQEELCRKWCEEHELDVDRVFVELGESAKTEDRAEFQKLFRYLDTVHDRISHLVVWKSDRLFRNSTDAGIYRRQLRKLGIRDVSVTEPIEDSPTGDFHRTIMSAVDQLDNDNRALRSHISMKARFKDGFWVWSPPVGYKRAILPDRRIVVDPERAPMIAKMFEMIATGQATKANVLAHLTQLGLTTKRGKALTQQTVKQILANELYCGRMVAKKWNLIVKGTFTPIISEDTFDRVQAVLSGRAKVTTPHKRQNEVVPMKGSLLCPMCGALLTGSTSKGASGARHAYYRCYKVAGHFNVRASLLETALEKLFMEMEPDPARMNAVVGLFRSIWNERQSAVSIEVEAMRSQLKKLEKKESRLTDSLAEGAITSQIYKRVTAPISAEMESIRQELASQKFDELDVEDAVSYLQSMFWNLLSLWQGNNLAQRSSLLKLLFPTGLVYRAGVLEPNSTNSFFSSLGDEKVEEIILASPTRFELVLSP